MEVWVIALVVVVLAVVGAGLSVNNRLNREADRHHADGEPSAEELRRLARDIDRGKDAGRDFIAAA